MTPADWIEHRRGDRELLGWMAPSGDGFVVHDLLGRPRTPPLDWLAAEEFLEQLGIGYLADRYVLVGPDGSERPVRIGEASAAGVTVVADEFGAAQAVGANPERIPLPFPVPVEVLRAE
jgi:ABC-type cobalamin/Fe3+-siderophores transport systems, ATPase components